MLFTFFFILADVMLSPVKFTKPRQHPETDKVQKKRNKKIKKILLKKTRCNYNKNFLRILTYHIEFQQ